MISSYHTIVNDYIFVIIMAKDMNMLYRDAYFVLCG